MLFSFMFLASSLATPPFPNSLTTALSGAAVASPSQGPVAADWAGPAIPPNVIELNGQEFNPEVGILGAANLCVIMPNQPIPECAKSTDQSLQITADVFDGPSNPDATCQSIETTRTGKDGRPERVFATVCGEALESWSYRQRATPASRGAPSRATNRTFGPNDLNPVAPELSN
jgi:hypothetical protein